MWRRRREYLLQRPFTSKGGFYFNSLILIVGDIPPSGHGFYELGQGDGGQNENEVKLS